MNAFVVPSWLLLLAIGLGAQETPGSTAEAPTTTRPSVAVLRVKVADLRNQTGHLRLGIFQASGAKGFPRDRSAALLWRSVPADRREEAFKVELPPGEYAIVVLHDENSNKKLDTFLGVPTEGHGVSNNPKPLRRSATYDEAAFTLASHGAEQTISIQYKYW